MRETVWAARPWVFTLLLGIVAVLAPAEAIAQEPGRSFATPFLSADHWAVVAVRRLEGLGLAPEGFGWTGGGLTIREVARVIESAVDRATGSEYADLAAAYEARFAEEFGAVSRVVEGDGEVAPGPIVLGSSAFVGYEQRDGAFRAGLGYRDSSGWTGPVPIADYRSAAVVLNIHTALSRSLAVGLASGWREDGLSLDEVHATFVHRATGLWIGRRPIGFGPGMGGGIVLSGSTAIDGGGIFLADPITLPGPFGWLGPVRFDLTLSRLEDSGLVRSPWFWAARGSVRPHPRLMLGVNRAVIFGGEGNTTVRARDLAYIIIGKHAGRGSELDNQIVSIDLRYRVPLSQLPLAVYVEWGFEDSAGAWKDVPGAVIGGELAAVPGLIGLSLGLERASFSGSCCGNPIWYRHWKLLGGWTNGGLPLGHPLGGHGNEWRAWGRADLNEARTRVGVELFARDRGPENLFAPDLAGRSKGARLSLEARPIPGLELMLHGSVERGEADWRTMDLATGIRWIF